MSQKDARRSEWIRLMLELAELDPGEYERFKAEAWEAVARSHRDRPASYITEWNRKAS